MVRAHQLRGVEWRQACTASSQVWKRHRSACLSNSSRRGIPGGLQLSVQMPDTPRCLV